ncbi:dihydropteroate synthase [Facilibium subflavum]|uniref:dihydropteroate synthase n=1 Tax=Facilibium subflavum TaxID=2219058 RepID=UPI000E656694|nr:dihydropteroate synthase [Facilibium subflavum]
MADVILGLGSNLGRKLDHLSQAIELIKEHVGVVKHISSVYQTKALLPEGAPKEWDLDYYNIALQVKTHLTPLALLDALQEIEQKLGREKDHEFWSPRQIDIDILTFDHQAISHERLIVPHEGLLKRRFALAPLLEIVPNWQYPGQSIDLYKTLYQMPPIKLAPFGLSGSKIVGIVNLSLNSFSGDGQQPDLKTFQKQILSMIESGCQVIDIGAESTKPHVTPKTPEMVWHILKPYLKSLDQLFKEHTFPTRIDVSIDTYHIAVIENALQFACVTMINDVYGYDEAKIAALIGQTDVKYVFMHQLGKASGEYIPADEDCLESICLYAKRKIQMLLELGVKKEQLIFDVGIGFGKHAFQVKKILENIALIKKHLNVPILIGHSRKRSASLYTCGEAVHQKDIITAMISRDLCKQKIDYIRVHDVSLALAAKFS